MINEIAKAFGVAPEELEMITKENEMNIKEIALKVARKNKHAFYTDEGVIAFAEVLIAELSKDAEHACEALGEPGSAVRWWWSDYGLSLPKGTKLYTHPQPVEAIEQSVAEACALKLESEANTLASTCGYEDMGGLSFGRGDHAEAKMGRYNELLELAEAIRSGEWRRFEK